MNGREMKTPAVLFFCVIYLWQAFKTGYEVPARLPLQGVGMKKAYAKSAMAVACGGHSL